MFACYGPLNLLLRNGERWICNVRCHLRACRCARAGETGTVDSAHVSTRKTEKRSLKSRTCFIQESKPIALVNRPPSLTQLPSNPLPIPTHYPSPLTFLIFSSGTKAEEDAAEIRIYSNLLPTFFLSLRGDNGVNPGLRCGEGAIPAQPALASG